MVWKLSLQNFSTVLMVRIPFANPVISLLARLSIHWLQPVIAWTFP
jgi:hypothetical protein